MRSLLTATELYGPWGNTLSQANIATMFEADPPVIPICGTQHVGAFRASGHAERIRNTCDWTGR
jgi:hypothetical protein